MGGRKGNVVKVIERKNRRLRKERERKTEQGRTTEEEVMKTGNSELLKRNALVPA